MFDSLSLSLSLSLSAERDLRTIHAWIRSRSLEGAERWLSALEAVVVRLSQSASEFPHADESERIGIPLREQTFKTRRGLPYRLVFTIHDDTVEIVAIRGSGQGGLHPDDLDLVN